MVIKKGKTITEAELKERVQEFVKSALLEDILDDAEDYQKYNAITGTTLDEAGYSRLLEEAPNYLYRLIPEGYKTYPSGKKPNKDNSGEQGGESGNQGSEGSQGGESGNQGSEGSQGGNQGSEVIPEVDKTPISSEEDLNNIDNPAEADIVISSSDVANLLTSSTEYRSIELDGVEVETTDIKLNANENVTIDGMTVGGAKGGTNGKVIYNTPELNINNVSLKEGTTAYNIFEGGQDVNNPVSSVKLTNSTFDQPTLKHNVLNVYVPDNNANILIKDCSFSLDPENSNVLRISNIGNADNVTVTFENVDWDYAQYNGTDYSYAGLVMYQAYGADAAYSKATTPSDDHIKTWNFVFKNCKYNGTKVTDNGYGTQAQVIYGYDVMTNGKSDGATLFNVTFE